METMPGGHDIISGSTGGVRFLQCHFGDGSGPGHGRSALDRPYRKCAETRVIDPGLQPLDRLGPKGRDSVAELHPRRGVSGSGFVQERVEVVQDHKRYSVQDGAEGSPRRPVVITIHWMVMIDAQTVRGGRAGLANRSQRLNTPPPHIPACKPTRLVHWPCCAPQHM